MTETVTAEYMNELVNRHCEFYEGGDVDAQAIADELNAALGSDAKPCYATDYTHERCKYSVNRGWTEDTKFYIPTATLGGGECEIETTENWLPAERYHRCKNCGAFFAVMNASGDIPPCVCPNCGKAVKR